MTKKEKEPIVFIAWIGKSETTKDMHFSFLAYDGGRGQIRTYYKDKIDSRLTGWGKLPMLQYFDTFIPCLEWMMKNRDEPCQVDRKLAREFGLKKKELAEVCEYQLAL